MSIILGTIILIAILIGLQLLMKQLRKKSEKKNRGKILIAKIVFCVLLIFVIITVASILFGFFASM